MPFRCKCLAEQGYTLDSIPPAGQQVLIRRNANLSTGGTAADVTDFVHPEIAARAIEAARMVGLDVAGRRRGLRRHRPPAWKSKAA